MPQRISTSVVYYTLTQVLEVFKDGRESSTIVEIFVKDDASKILSLKQLSLLDEAMWVEIYIGRMHQILSIMQQVRKPFEQLSELY